MAKLEALMEKKKDGKEMDPVHKDAKMSMLKELRDQMVEMMKGDLQKPGMKKVEVSSNDKEGLAHGLDKAKELIGAADEGSEQDEPEGDMEHGVGSPDMYDVSPEMEDAASEGESAEEEHAELSPEEEAHLEHLLSRSKKHQK